MHLYMLIFTNVQQVSIVLHKYSTCAQAQQMSNLFLVVQLV